MKATSPLSCLERQRGAEAARCLFDKMPHRDAAAYAAMARRPIRRPRQRHAMTLHASAAKLHGLRMIRDHGRRHGATGRRHRTSSRLRGIGRVQERRVRFQIWRTSSRMVRRRSSKHGTWMTVKRTRGFLIIVSPNNSFLLANFQLSYPELGILSWRLNADDWENDENLKKIREARGYSYMDICDVCPEKLPNYEAKLKNFFEEHLHTDEEIRYCIEGSGYFDVRDQNDQWIRVAVKKGGMIVLPAGMYHRFTLDSDNYIKAMRLFVGEPVWTPYNRPHDHLPARKEYVEKIMNRGGTQAVESR